MKRSGMTLCLFLCHVLFIVSLLVRLIFSRASEIPPPPLQPKHYLTVLLHLIFFYLSVIFRNPEAMTGFNLIRFSNAEKPTTVNLENYDL